MADAGFIRSRVQDTADTGGAVLADGKLLARVAKVAETVTTALRGGRKAVFFGNGGSAADATHLAAEFVGRFCIDRPPLPALSLTDNGSSMSAIGNDYSYEETFARQIRALGARGDVAIGLSTSGHSENVVRGLQAAREIGMTAVAFTGQGGGDCLAAADVCLQMPSTTTARIQEAYMMLCHALCEQVERGIFGEGT